MTGLSRSLAIAAGIALALALLGLSLRLLLVPAYTHALVLAVDAPVLADLPAAETVELAEQVRALVAGTEGVTLPATLPDGRPAFDEKAVSHLEDVRAVIAGALVATFVATVVAAALFAAFAWRREPAATALALRATAWTLAAPVALAFVLAAFDFDRVFAWFHALFFEAGTWQFAHDALLIRLFPEPFWMASGAVWGSLVLASAALCALLSRLAMRRFITEG